MIKDKYISIGKLGKPHGISGAFRFLLHRELKSRKKLPAYFMIEVKGSVIPHFIKSLEIDGLISFEEITNPETAKKISGSELLLPEEEVELYFKKDAEAYQFLKGYKAVDESAGEIGIIEEINETPGQIMLMIRKGEEEIMIPLVEDFIIKLDKRKKELIFNLPEGLLEL